MATERKTPGASSSQIPDLEVRAKGPSKATAPAPVARADIGTSNDPGPPSGVAGDVQDYFGSGTFDADHFGDVGASLQTSGTISTAPKSMQAWPTGCSPDGASLVIDAVEVRLAADYGPAPKNAFSSPFYAVRVARRRGELEANTRQLAGALADAEKRRDELLVATALELRGKVLLVEGGEDLFAPAVEIEHLALERRSSLAGTNAEYDSRVQELEVGAQGLRQEAARKDVEVEQAAQALARQREMLERVMAKKKRLYIEIRGIMDAAEKTGSGFSAAQSARIAALEAAVASHSPDVERAEREVATAETLLAAAEADAKQIARRRMEAERVRHALDEEFRKQIGVRAEGVSESEHARSQALSDVMRKILAARGDIVEVPEESLEGIVKADQAVHARALELEKFVRALDAFDYDMYGRGRLLIGVAIALVIAVIVVALL